MLVVVINQSRLFSTMPIIDVGLGNKSVLRGNFGRIKCKF